MKHGAGAEVPSENDGSERIVKGYKRMEVSVAGGEEKVAILRCFT